jgi:hypothetical protein
VISAVLCAVALKLLLLFSQFSLLAVPAHALYTASTSAAHTKVFGNNIVQSTRRYVSGVIPFAHCVSMESNRTRVA